MTQTMKETGKAKKALEEYLLLGPDRSLAKLGKAMGKSDSYVALLERWSSAHKWQEQAREYDKEQAEKRRRAIEAARREMDREHALWGKDQALLAIQAIKDLMAEGKYNPATANQLFKIATDLQRLAMGSATEQIALTGKDGGKVEMDVIVETFWGRGTDPRNRADTAEPAKETDDLNDEDTELIVEFDDDDEEP